jgi:hypothetical protein
MDRPGKGVRAALAAICVTIVVGLAGQAGSAFGATRAVDLTTVYSQRLAKAVFARHYAAVWKYIDPRYQSVVREPHWKTCIAQLTKASSTYHIVSIHVSGARPLPTRLPVLGKVTMVDVSLQLLYRQPGSR